MTDPCHSAYAIRSGEFFYDADKNDWTSEPLPDCLYSHRIQVDNALKFARQTHPDAQVVRYKIIPDTN